MSVKDRIASLSRERLYLLVRNRILEDGQAFAVGAAVVFGFKLLLLLLAGRGPTDEAVRSLGPAWTLLMGIGGVLLAGRAFERMHDGRGATDWLLLPATALEKYSAAALTYLALYPLAASAAGLALSGIHQLIALVLNVQGSVLWTPWSHISWGQAMTYLLFTAFALAGSARWRKLALVKTLGFAVGWTAFLGVLFTVLCIVLGNHGRTSLGFQSGGNFVLNLNNAEISAGKGALVGWILTGSNLVAFGCALCYGYFRVTEKEAVDEVQ